MGKLPPPGTTKDRLRKIWWRGLICKMIGLQWKAIKNAFVKPTQFDVQALPKRTGQTIVMTGGSRGIGISIVKKLLQLDYTILLGARNVDLCGQVIAKLRETTGITSGQVRIFHLNLQSLDSVREFASQVLASNEGSRIDVILNNAGIAHEHYAISQDGYEDHFQVNYLSHFLLTQMLLPRLRETSKGKGKHEPCHIIHTSSHIQSAGRIDFDELETSKVYYWVDSYTTSKLCQIMNMTHLAKMFQKCEEDNNNINVHAIHPGEIPTEMWNDLHKSMGLIGRFNEFTAPLARCFQRTTEHGANAVLAPLLDPGFGAKHQSGYMENGKVVKPNGQVERGEICERLFYRSLELVGLWVT